MCGINGINLDNTIQISFDSALQKKIFLTTLNKRKKSHDMFKTILRGLYSSVFQTFIEKVFQTGMTNGSFQPSIFSVTASHRLFIRIIFLD